MNVRIEESWGARLQEEFEKPYFQNLTTFVKGEYKLKKVFPPGPEIFSAFDLCPFENVRVVILGQDPYHGMGQAHGLSFSVKKGVRLPPSLQNIYKEIESDLGLDMPSDSGDLSEWAAQGVLLLNATLTVAAHQAGSHQGKGWEEFTDVAIKKISDEKEHVVFLLWGRYAQNKGAVIDRSKHLVLEAPHPSPFSAHSGFFGCKHFSKTNEYLAAHGLEPIIWGE